MYIYNNDIHVSRQFIVFTQKESQAIYKEVYYYTPKKYHYVL